MFCFFLEIASSSDSDSSLRFFDCLLGRGFCICGSIIGIGGCFDIAICLNFSLSFSTLSVNAVI